MRTLRLWVKRRPVIMYFILVLAISYGAFGGVVGPKLIRGGTEQASDAEFVLFPILDMGVLLTALALSAILSGTQGVRALFAPMGRWRVNVLWYAVALLLPPALALGVLQGFHLLVSPAFAPKVFLLGALFGLPAFIEEIGWTGFAYPKMRLALSPFVAALLLGVLWGLWHAPVVDYLGAAAPHRSYWLPFFAAFIAIVTAMRVLISWVFTNTGSLLLAQLMHVSMTASLVIFDPVNLTPAQETAWYLAYAVALWCAVGIVIMVYGKRLARQPASIVVGATRHMSECA